MQFLQNLDTGLFRLVHESFSNRFFDWLMPIASGNPAFIPVVVLVAAALLFRGGARGRMFLLFLALAIFVTDSLLCNNLKHLIGRPRPFLTLVDVVPLIGKGGSGSMPSSHSANWAAGAFTAFLFYRRSLWFMVPMTFLISFSRIYNGVHYPADVLVGWIVGMGGAAFVAVAAQSLWYSLGRSFAPRWYARMPSLLNPVLQPPPSAPC